MCAVVVERLVGPDFFIFLPEREGEGEKWAENAQNRPVRAVQGHFGPFFHHFPVLEPSRGHFCITFLLNWVPRSFPRRCVIPRAEFSFLRSNVTGQRTRHLVAGTLDPLVGRFFGLLVFMAWYFVATDACWHCHSLTYKYCYVFGCELNVERCLPIAHQLHLVVL